MYQCTSDKLQVLNKNLEQPSIYFLNNLLSLNEYVCKMKNKSSINILQENNQFDSVKLERIILCQNI